MATESTEVSESSKVNQASKGMVALIFSTKKKIRWKINISSDSLDKHTTSDVDSVEATSTPTLNIVLNIPQENLGFTPW